MRKVYYVVLMFAILASEVLAAPNGLLFTYIKEPVAVTALDGYSKVGYGSNFGFFQFVAIGDAGISAAAKNGNIKTIHHVDKEIIQIFFGFFYVETTCVYGN